ncbi:MAG: twin-arginine translocase TatA/TatE family subunit [Solirubrobacteraceae bacterium]
MGIENPVHLLFIGAVALVVLGPKRLPDLAKALGHGIREFREAMTEGEHAAPPVEQPPVEQPPAENGHRQP